MRKMSIVICSLILPTILMAVSHDSEFVRAAARGAKFKECLLVVDQDGTPVSGAKVGLGIWRTESPSDAKCISGVTDKNGRYIAEGVVGPFLNYSVVKDGYYLTRSQILFGHSKTPDQLKDGCWLPYGDQMVVVLKKVVDPSVPGSKYWEGRVPSQGEWIGFDLEKIDWVAPFGNGVVSDVMIKISGRIDGDQDYGYKMELKFDGSPLSGAYLCKKDDYSEFKTCYRADVNENYLKEFVFEYDRSSEGVKVDSLFGENRYVVFRVRTKLNDDGSLRSACYGTVRGDWQFAPTTYMRVAGVYFNPKPNDTNLEDVHSVKSARQRRIDAEDRCQSGSLK